MLDETLAAAFIDGGKRHKILGQRLRPFSLWHRLLLQAIDSPFLRKGTVNFFDLRTAVAACQLRFPDSCIVRSWLFRKWPLSHGVNQFLAYAGDYLSRPEYAIIPPKPVVGAPPEPKRGIAPEIVIVAGDIIGWSGWSPELVWNLPIGQSYWYQMLARRGAGADVDFVTEEERAFQAEIREASQKP